ncbi:MAG TPA: DUF5684 domain-containing protein [Clostridia bacterium]|nr:DUF5684 domain-containing protein [Clostridia bacterium]
MQASYADSVVGGILALVWIVYLAILVLEIASYWILFVKAGKPGWGSLIPFYNTYLILKIGGRPGWWLLLLFIPFVDIVIGIMMIASFLKAYGKGGAGSVLLAIFFSIFYFPYLAFSKNVKYVGAIE